jgi:hypothetical protein
MSFIEKNLSPKEKLIIRPKIHWFVLVNGPAIAMAGYSLHSHQWSVQTGQWVARASVHKWWYMLNNYTLEDVIELGVNMMPLVAILLGVYLTVLGLIRKSSIDMGITSRRVVLKEGLIHTDTDDLSFNDIESVDIHQSPFGKMLDFGDITFNGIAHYGSKRAITFRWVTNPSRIRRVALAGLDAYAPATPKSLL